MLRGRTGSRCPRRSGGIGRRTSLRGWRPQGCGGSSPPSDTYDLAIPDFHDFFNAVSPNPTSLPSHVSFEVRWAGGPIATPVHDSTFDFSGTFIESDATIDFTVRNDGNSVVYRSDPAGQSSDGAGVGRERNGVFFSSAAAPTKQTLRDAAAR